MKNAILLFLSYCIMGVSGFGQSLPLTSLRTFPQLNCEGSILTTQLQIKAFGEESVEIGTSSIYVTYNPDAIQFKEYQSINFNEHYTCVGGVASPWAKQQFDAYSKPGHFNLTLILKGEGSTCEELTAAAWINIGALEFEIVDKNLSPDIRINTEHTHLNGAELNNGTQSVYYKRGENVSSHILDCENLGSFTIESFDVAQLNADIELNWESSDLPVGGYFVIERSLDKHLFRSLGELSEQSEGGEIFSYKDTDALEATTPKLYYRIKAVNVDGGVTYSEIKSIEVLSAEMVDLKIGPNPAQSQINFQISLPQESNFEFLVLNTVGQTMHQEKIIVSEEITQKRLDVSSWTPGVYFFKIEDEVHSFAKSIVVQ